MKKMPKFPMVLPKTGVKVISLNPVSFVDVQPDPLNDGKYSPVYHGSVDLEYKETENFQNFLDQCHEASQFLFQYIKNPPSGIEKCGWDSESIENDYMYISKENSTSFRRLAYVEREFSRNPSEFLKKFIHLFFDNGY